MGTTNKRGRKPGFIMPAEHRLKIQNSNILNYLIKHVEGKREMGPSQVTAALGLLKKALPDLSTVTLEGGDKPIQLEQIQRTIVDPNPNR